MVAIRLFQGLETVKVVRFIINYLQKKQLWFNPQLLNKIHILLVDQANPISKCRSGIKTSVNPFLTSRLLNAT